MANNQKPTKKHASVVPINLVNDAQKELTESFENDSKYALNPDPEGKIGLTEEEKLFITWYIQYRNVPLASQLAGVDEAQGQKFFLSEKCRGEIRRINLALYARQFSRRLLTIDEIGGYLTSILVDQDVTERNVLSARDKLNVAKMIIDLNKLKMESYDNPEKINAIEVEADVKDLTADQLKKIIDSTMYPSGQDDKRKKKEYEEKALLISHLNDGGYLDPAEMAYLQTLSKEQIKELLKKGIEQNETDKSDVSIEKETSEN